MSSEDFDRHFREKLSAHRTPLDTEGLWNGVEAGLSGRRKSAAFWWAAGAAALLMAGALLNYVFMPEQVQNSPSTVAETGTASSGSRSENAAEVPIESDDASAAKQENHSYGMSEAKAAAAVDETENRQKAANSTTKQDENSADSGIQGVPERINRTAEKRRFINERSDISLPDRNLAADTEEQPDSENEPQASENTAAETGIRAGNTPSAQEAPREANAQTTADLSGAEFSENEMPRTDLSAKTESGKEAHRATIPPATDGKSDSAYGPYPLPRISGLLNHTAAGPVFNAEREEIPDNGSASALSGRFLSAVFGAGGFDRSFVPLHDNARKHAAQRSATEHPLEYLTGQFSLGKRYANGFFWRSGISVTRINEHFLMDRTKTETTESTVVTGIHIDESGDTLLTHGTATETTVTHEHMSHYNRYTLIDIPLFIGLDKDFGRWRIGAEVGFFANALTIVRGSALMQEAEVIRMEDHDLYKPQLRVSPAINGRISYLIGDRVSLEAAPGVRYIPEEYMSAGDIGHRVWMFGGTFGMGYAF